MTDRTKLAARFVRVLFLTGVGGFAYFATLLVVATYARSSPRVLLTFAVLALLNAYLCARARRWQRSLVSVRGTA